jgi:hypothetical protein
MHTPQKLLHCARKLCAANLDEKGDNVATTGVFTLEELGDAENRQDIRKRLKKTFLPQAYHQEKLRHDPSFLGLNTDTVGAENFAWSRILQTPTKASWVHTNYVSRLQDAGYEVSEEGINRGKRRIKQRAYDGRAKK